MKTVAKPMTQVALSKPPTMWCPCNAMAVPAAMTAVLIRNPYLPDQRFFTGSFSVGNVSVERPDLKRALVVSFAGRYFNNHVGEARNRSIVLAQHLRSGQRASVMLNFCSDTLLVLNRPGITGPRNLAGLCLECARFALFLFAFAHGSPFPKRSASIVQRSPNIRTALRSRNRTMDTGAWPESAWGKG